MPFNGSGGFTIINTFVPGTTILSSAVNQNYSDIATTGLSNCLTKDGQQVWGANQKAGGFKITGLTTGSASTDSCTFGQLTNQSVPVGTVVDFAGTTAPSLWYLCFGQAVSRTTYSSLFGIIGTSYGIGDGVSTFNLPDYRGRIGAGLDNMGGTPASRIGTVVTDSGTIVGTTMGSNGGSSTHVQASGELATHNHTGSGNVNDPGHTHVLADSYVQNIAGVNSLGGSSGLGIGNATNSNTTGITVPSLNINNAGSSTAMAWLQPTLIVTKIIFANA